jgi:GxxExxY protein
VAFDNEQLTEKVIGLAIEVHRQLGPGLLESAYEECLCYELVQAKFVFQRQVALPIVYKSVRLDCGYRLDLIVENRLILELKTVERFDADPRGASDHLYEAERDTHWATVELQLRRPQARHSSSHAAQPYRGA